MDNSDNESAARIDALERSVADLSRRLQALEAARAPVWQPAGQQVGHAPYAPSAPRAGASAAPAAAGSHTQAPSGYAPPKPLVEPASSADWVSRIGIALLVVGCGFLYRYSVEQGWIDNGLRVVFGFALAAGLLGLGLYLGARRPRYSDILVGGGIATFHLTFFTAYAYYDLIGMRPALLGSAVFDILSVGIALRRGRSALALVGVLGACASPFLLQVPATAAVFVSVYLGGIFVLIGTLAVLRPWGAVFGIGAVASWVTLIAMLELATPVSSWGILTVLCVAWTAMGIAPLLRRLDHPGRDNIAYSVAIVSPFLVALVGQVARPRVLGSAHLVIGAGVLALLAWGLWKRERGVPAAALGAACVAAIVASTYVGEPWAPALVAALAATGLHLVNARGLAMRPVQWGVHFVAGVAALGVLGNNFIDTELSIRYALRQMSLAMVLGSFLISLLWVERRNARTLLVVSAQVLAFSWCFVDVGHWVGQGAVALCWGLIAVAEVIAGAVRRNKALLQLGYAGLGVMVFKLLVLDMATVAAIWRILLFMGFGAVFLALGYFVPRLSGEEPEA